MKPLSAVVLISLIGLSACSTYQVGGEIQPGRRALLLGNPKEALAHFERAAQINPDHLSRYTGFREGVWTYVGRAYYADGNFSAAREALERARRQEEDDMAKLYLGLVLARGGDRDRGIKELEAGLRGLGNSLERADQFSTDGRYWDPGRILRTDIEKQLAMLSASENINQVIAGGERLGVELEREVEASRRQRRHEKRDNDGRGGGRAR